MDHIHLSVTKKVCLPISRIFGFFSPFHRPTHPIHTPKSTFQDGAASQRHVQNGPQLHQPTSQHRILASRPTNSRLDPLAPRNLDPTSTLPPTNPTKRTFLLLRSPSRDRPLLGHVSSRPKHISGTDPTTLDGRRDPSPPRLHPEQLRRSTAAADPMRRAMPSPCLRRDRVLPLRIHD